MNLKRKLGNRWTWRKITQALKKLHINNTNKSKDNTDEINPELRDCENTLNQTGSDVPLVSSKETCQGNLKGITTHAVVANSARDMSVGAVIRYYPP